MWLYSRKHDRRYSEILDFFAPLVPLGYAAGRLGNFINAELPGRVANASLPWAMIWPNVDMLPRHPSPLYQALIDGILAFVVLWIFSRKARPTGAVGAIYLLLYGVFRFFTEYFREPDYSITLMGLPLSAGQMLSLPMILGSLVWLRYAYAKRPGTNLQN
jgi:phosphatidylglycerol:prolipoprotein diacylglycerol transferase